jgi:hypothetical protein
LTNEEKDSIVVKKQGISKEEVQELLKATTKEILEAVTPKEKTQSVSEVIAKPSEDYRVKLIESLGEFNEGAKANWKWTHRDDSAEIGKIIGDVKPSEDQKKLLETICNVVVTAAVPEIWSSEVSRGCRYPESAFWEASFIDWRNDLYGKPGKEVNIITVGTTACVDLACDEPTTVCPTVGHVPCYLVEKGCAYYICKQDLEDVIPDTIDALNEGLGRCLAVCIDNYFLGQAMITNAGTVSFSTCLTAAKIACAKDISIKDLSANWDRCGREINRDRYASNRYSQRSQMPIL